MRPIDVKEIRKKHGLSQEEFANRLGVNIRTVQNYEQGAKITPAMIKLIEYEFISESNYSSSPEINSLNEPDVSIVSGKKIMKVPLVHQYAYAGYLSGYGDSVYLDDLPMVPFMVDTLPKGNYMAFEVKGDSMDDGSIRSYPARCLILCREIQRHHWMSRLHIHKWDFVIVHQTDGILLKKIIHHDVENGIITLHSLNELYDDFQIKLDNVVQIFNVVKKVIDQ